MARGIGNRQKRVVTAKKVWVKPSPSPAGRGGREGTTKGSPSYQKSQRRTRPHPSPLPEGEGT